MSIRAKLDELVGLIDERVCIFQDGTYPCKNQSQPNCHECYVDQILTHLKAEIEKCRLTDEEIEQIYFECGGLNKPSLHYLNERLAQAQVKKAIELLEEK